MVQSRHIGVVVGLFSKDIAWPLFWPIITHGVWIMQLFQNAMSTKSRKSRKSQNFWIDFFCDLRFFTQWLKPLPCRSPAPGEVFLAFWWDKVYSRASQRALWAAMVARVSPSCTGTELRRLISSAFSPQAMVFAKAVTAAVRLQAFISESPFHSAYARRGWGDTEKANLLHRTLLSFINRGNRLRPAF